MKKLILVLSLIALGAPPVHADFHFWDIQEVYTNADGSIQFIEFFTTASGQQVLAAHTLSSTGATNFTFPSNLPLNSPLTGHPNTASTTANETFLVATANFTALFGIVPDYIIPAGFLQSGIGNVLDFESGTDTINLTSLPTDGIQSLNANINSASPTTFTFNTTATPRNFRGESSTIPEPKTGTLFLAAGLLLLAQRRIAHRRSML